MGRAVNHPHDMRWRINKVSRRCWECNGVLFTTQRAAIEYRKKNNPTPARRVTDRADEFAEYLRIYAPDLYATVQREHHFALKRRWRFDFAWVRYGVAVEIDGGQYIANGGRHATDADRDKINTAAALGWRVLRFSPKVVEGDTLRCIRLIRETIKRAIERWQPEQEPLTELPEQE